MAVGMRNIRRVASACVVALGVYTVPAYAVPVTLATNDAPPECKKQTLDKYIDLGGGGCIIDDKIFSDFKYMRVGNTGIAASAVTVTPMAAPKGADIEFAGMWTGSLVNTITYSVATVSGKPLIEDATLAAKLKLDRDKTASTSFRECLPWEKAFSSRLFRPQRTLHHYH